MGTAPWSEWTRRLNAEQAGSGRRGGGARLPQGVEPGDSRVTDAHRPETSQSCISRFRALCVRPRDPLRIRPAGWEHTGTTSRGCSAARLWRAYSGFRLRALQGIAVSAPYGLSSIAMTWRTSTNVVHLSWLPPRRGTGQAVRSLAEADGSAREPCLPAALSRLQVVAVDLAPDHLPAAVHPGEDVLAQSAAVDGRLLAAPGLQHHDVRAGVDPFAVSARCI